MDNLGLLLPAPQQLDKVAWATVTGTSPLRIRIDGEANPLTITPDSTTGPLTVADRVLVALATNDNPNFRARRVTIIGKPGGTVTAHTHPQSAITNLVSDIAALYARPYGELGFAERTSDSSGTSSTTELPVLRLDDIGIGSGRSIRVYTNTIEVQSSVNNDSFTLRLRYTTDGSTPTISSTEFAKSTAQTLDAQGSGSGVVSRRYTAASAETLSFLLTLQRRSGTGSLNTVGRSQIVMQDNGPAISNTGTAL